MCLLDTGLAQSVPTEHFLVWRKSVHLCLQVFTPQPRPRHYLLQLVALSDGLGQTVHICSGKNTGLTLAQVFVLGVLDADVTSTENGREPSTFDRVFN